MFLLSVFGILYNMFRPTLPPSVNTNKYKNTWKGGQLQHGVM